MRPKNVSSWAERLGQARAQAHVMSMYVHTFMQMCMCGHGYANHIVHVYTQKRPHTCAHILASKYTCTAMCLETYTPNGLRPGSGPIKGTCICTQVCACVFLGMAMCVYLSVCVEAGPQDMYVVGAPYQVLGGLLLGIFSRPFWHPPVFEGPLAIKGQSQSEALEVGFV
jgi:hypothetical protein